MKNKIYYDHCKFYKNEEINKNINFNIIEFYIFYANNLI